MAAMFELQTGQAVGVDRDLAFSLVAETMAEAERAFGQKTDGALLERYALEAAIDLLSRPAKVHDFLPELAIHAARQAQSAR
jgi:hypothetical protein